MSRHLVTLLLAAAVGCGRHDHPPQGAPATGSDGSATVGSASAPVITVLAPGAEPRRLLAYAPTRGDRHATLKMTMSNDDDAPPKTAPKTPEDPMRMTMQLAWHSPSALAQPWTFEVETSHGEPTPGASAGEQAAINTIYKAFETVRGEVHATSSQDLWPETHSLPATRPDVASLLLMVLVPLPATPIGVGARWRVQKSDVMDTTYELSELTADHLTVRMSGGVTTSEGGQSVAETVSGTSTVQLSDPLPTAADVTMHLKMHMTLNGGSDSPTASDVPDNVDLDAAIHVQIAP